jgi:hypothetical protein
VQGSKWSQRRLPPAGRQIQGLYRAVWAIHWVNDSENLWFSERAELSELYIQALLVMRPCDVHWRPGMAPVGQIKASGVKS